MELKILASHESYYSQIYCSCFSSRLLSYVLGIGKSLYWLNGISFWYYLSQSGVINLDQKSEFETFIFSLL